MGRLHILCADSYCFGTCWDNGDSCAHPGVVCQECGGDGESLSAGLCRECNGLGVVPATRLSVAREKEEK